MKVDRPPPWRPVNLSCYNWGDSNSRFLVKSAIIETKVLKSLDFRTFWWTRRDSNPRPLRCERSAHPRGTVICDTNRGVKMSKPVIKKSKKQEKQYVSLQYQGVFVADNSAYRTPLFLWHLHLGDVIRMATKRATLH